MKLPGGGEMTAPKSIPTGGLDFLGKTLINTLSLFFIAAIVLCLVFLVLGGIQWTTSGGDKNKLAAAKAKLTWAVIGLVVSLSTLFIISVFGYFFGVDLLRIKA